jgi:hypothetical protein
MVLIHWLIWTKPVPFPFYAVIPAFCGEIPVDLRVEGLLCHCSTHVVVGIILETGFLVNCYGLTLGSCRLLLFALISAESDNLHLCTNLQKSVQYKVFKWWYYPKLYFSTLLNTAKNNGRSFDVLALTFFLWPLLKEIKKKL